MNVYQKLYHLMVDASERAIEALEQQNYGSAKDILIQAEQNAEELYIDSEPETGTPQQ